jgi:hypothetical protein
MRYDIIPSYSYCAPSISLLSVVNEHKNREDPVPWHPAIPDVPGIDIQEFTSTVKDYWTEKIKK